VRKVRGSLGTFCSKGKSCTKRQAAQGSLEYIIIIGGIIILAAASYFMLRGFTETTRGDTTGKIEIIGNEFELEIENLGRSEALFGAKTWLNSSYFRKRENS